MLESALMRLSPSGTPQGLTARRELPDASLLRRWALSLRSFGPHGRSPWRNPGAGRFAHPAVGSLLEVLRASWAFALAKPRCRALRSPGGGSLLEAPSGLMGRSPWRNPGAGRFAHPAVGSLLEVLRASWAFALAKPRCRTLRSPGGWLSP